MKSRKAFTLVELLVVIAIIGIFMAMSVPAVMAVREMARRSACTQKMAKIGMALQEYESANGVLPPGTTEPKGPIRNTAEGNHISWLVHLLPLIQEKVTFHHIDLAAGAYAEKNAAARSVRIGQWICPSEMNRGSAEHPASNYAGCHHDVEAPIDRDNRGVLFLDSRVALRDITDGAANTIFVGEKRTEIQDLGWMSGTRATLRNTGTPINDTLDPHGMAAPAEEPGSGAKVDPELAVGGFGSYHSGGANVLFGDGAVRFLNAEVEPTLYRQYGDRADSKLVRSGPTREE